MEATPRVKLCGARQLTTLDFITWYTPYHSFSSLGGSVRSQRRIADRKKPTRLICEEDSRWPRRRAKEAAKDPPRQSPLPVRFSGSSGAKMTTTMIRVPPKTPYHATAHWSSICALTRVKSCRLKKIESRLSLLDAARVFAASDAGTPFFASAYARNKWMDESILCNPKYSPRRLGPAVGSQYFDTRDISSSHSKIKTGILGTDGRARRLNIGTATIIDEQQPVLRSDNDTEENEKDKCGSRRLMYSAVNGSADEMRRLLEDGANLNVSDKWNNYTLLMRAAMNGNREVVCFLVEAGADVNATNNSNNTVLMWTAERGNIEIVRLLINKGANVNASNNHGESVLMHGARSGDVEVVRVLVDSGADVEAVDMNKIAILVPNSREGKMADVFEMLVRLRANIDEVDHEGKTMLMRAIERGNVEVVRVLLECGADIQATNARGNSVLIQAVKYDNAGIVRLLLENGADVQTTNIDGKSALIVAINHGNTEIMRILLENGADVHMPGNDGETALMRAASRGEPEAALLLLEYGAELHARNSLGSTALMVAAEFCHTTVVLLFLGCGADFQARNNFGETALMRAATSSSWQVILLLLGCGADTSVKSNSGDTALMLGVQWSNVVAVKLLGRHVSDIQAKNNEGETALMWAARYGNSEIIRFLLESGASVQDADCRGETALMRAVKVGNALAVGLLLEYGADASRLDSEGRSAIFFAIDRENTSLQRLLVQHVQHHRDIADSRNSVEVTPSSRQPSNSWHISPFEVELQSLLSSDYTGGEYRAKWLDADVVIKLFIAGVSPSTFAQEVILWHQLRHPNIIKLYGACGGRLNFFVCEFASNGSVAKYLGRFRRKGAQRQAWKLMLDAALGLAYLHERGIVHGNLRPSNILVGSDGLAKLTDFGLCAAATATKTFSFWQDGESRKWQSPEQLSNRVATFASDIYSLGLCIVKAVTGSDPWTGWSYIKRKLSWDPASNAYGNCFSPWNFSGEDKFARELRFLLSKMCGKDPDQRISASSVVQVLENIIASHCLGQDTNQSIEMYKRGALTRLWSEINSISTVPVCDLESEVLRDLHELFTRLAQSSQPRHLLDKFHNLVTSYKASIDASCHQNRIHRLSSTRATGGALHTIHRQVQVIWSLLGDSESAAEARKTRWEEQRRKQLDVFVSVVSETVLVLDDDEDRSTVLALVKAEIENHAADYSPSQLAVLQKVINEQASTDTIARMPAWFVPWYELVVDPLDYLAEGGYGSVYRARWLDTEVVVKQVKRVGAGSSGDSSDQSLSSARGISVPPSVTNTNDRTAWRRVREMFEYEANVWFGLSHPHVVRLFGACHVGTPFFACEYASNGSLDKYLRHHPIEIWKKLHEAALGVQYLHARDIVHGDLKCNNIVVGRDKKAKVTDFGLSSRSLVSAASHWVAPECLTEGACRLSPASDVYSLGMCVVEALRVIEAAQATEDGRRHIYPFPWCDFDNDVVKYHVATMHGLPPRPPLCSDAQWSLVERMCRHDPESRIQINTVVAELAQLANRAASVKLRRCKSATAASRWCLKAIADMKALMRSDENDGESEMTSNQTALRFIYCLLWRRLDHLASEVGALSYKPLQKLIESARDSTTRLPEVKDTLTQFTETALGGYALHRRLDQVMDACDWRLDGGVHNWTSQCSVWL